MLMYRMISDVPGIVAVGLWFVFQLVSGIASMGNVEGGGVAYAAHIGGFIAGLIRIKPFAAFAGHRERRHGNVYTPHIRRRQW